MRLALISDAFPPMRSSGAVQLRDLAREFARQGHDLTVLVSSPELDRPFVREDFDGATVLRLRTSRTRDTSYARRVLAELAMPWLMRRALRSAPVDPAAFDGVIWYSPAIFHAPLVRWLKRQSRAPGYLIIRDIFPQWALDTGVIKPGIAYRLLDRIARGQYDAADVIGVQTPGNKAFFADWAARPGHRLEVLHNWLGPPADRPCSIDVANTPLAGRKLFVYAGNMGVAQGMDRLLYLARQLRERRDIGFLFVGRGSDAERLAAAARDERLDNVLFHDEIDPDEIPALYRQCHVGLVALDPRHSTHNIPGKFLSYMQAGLPVLATINANNDLVRLVADERVGWVSSDAEGHDLATLAVEAMAGAGDLATAARCRDLAARMFDASAAVRQIVAALAR